MMEIGKLKMATIFENVLESSWFYLSYTLQLADFDEIVLPQLVKEIA